MSLHQHLAKIRKYEIPSVSSLIKKRVCTIVFDCLSNDICELFEKYFEKTDYELINFKIPKYFSEANKL